MLYTIENAVTFSLEDKSLEGLVLKKVCSLYNDEDKVGDVIQIDYGKSIASPGYLLQAEFYHQELQRDLFFENGLIKRNNSYEALDLLYRPLKGIVLSKGRMGIRLTNSKNVINIRPEWIEGVLESLSEQENLREEFADYQGVGISMGGFKGLDYQPPGPDVKKKTFLHKGKYSIKKETREVEEDGGGVTYEYWNDEKISMNFTLGDGLYVTFGRNRFELSYELTIGKREALFLKHKQIPALKKVIEIYQNPHLFK